MRTDTQSVISKSRSFSFRHLRLFRRLLATVTRSATPELLEHQRQIGKGDTHAAHDLHDLAVFGLQLLLLQFFKPRLLLGNFGLDLSISASIFALFVIAISKPPLW